MVKILNFGSINIDYVYSVPHFVSPGETLASTQFQTFLGGKGANQSIALGKAGAKVFHAGNINQADQWIIDQLEDWGVDCTFINRIEEASGHAIIQVIPEGENAILLHGGANVAVTSEQIEQVLQHFNKGDILLLQNEINGMAAIIDKAYEKGMIIFFNPAPMSEAVLDYPLEKIKVFILNAIEGKMLAGVDSIDGVLPKLRERFPRADFLLTLGSEGAFYQGGDSSYFEAAHKVDVVDTTGAGDTFTGYFLASYLEQASIQTSLKRATKAASITVSKKGAAVSIPFKKEIEAILD